MAGFVNLMTDCLQVNQFSKVTWYRVKAGAPEAFQVISRMNFPQQVYYDFLQEVTHNPHLKPEETACSWVQENRAVWEKWVPVSLTKRPKLYLAGLFPLTGGYWTAPGLVVGTFKITSTFIGISVSSSSKEY